jgi:hypothetical protein
VAGEVKSIAEHWDVLWVVVCGLFGVVVFLIWQTIRRIERAIESIFACLREMSEKYVSDKDFTEWKSGRVDIWSAINKHTHDTKGRVVRDA